MNMMGPFRAEISGAPYLRFDRGPHGARFTVCDSGDDTTLNAIPFWCDGRLATRLERAVQAFNRAIAEHEKVRK